MRRTVRDQKPLIYVSERSRKFFSADASPGAPQPFIQPVTRRFAVSNVAAAATTSGWKRNLAAT